MEKSQQSEERPKNNFHIVTLAVQCYECSKLREIPTDEEYIEIRSQLSKDPFVCSKKPGVSCNDPTDIEYNNSQTWIMDRPNIPKAPNGFKRIITADEDFSKIVCYYDAPNGEKLNGWLDVACFLENNPEYKDGLSIWDFSFLVPKLRKDIPPAIPAKD